MSDTTIDHEARIRLLEAELAVARRDYERAQNRTFELSEHVAQVRKDAQPLRDLLREVMDEAIPNWSQIQFSADSTWARVVKAIRQ